MGDKVYGGTGNVGHLFSYDPATGQSQDLGQALYPFEKIRSLTVYNDKIYGGTADFVLDAHLFLFDPAGGNVTDLGVAVPDQNGIYALTTASSGLVYGGADSHLFVHNPSLGTNTDLGVSPSGRTVYALQAGGDGQVYGGTYGGNLFAYDPSGSGFINLGQPVPGETIVRSLTWGADDRLYGGTGWANGRFFSYDPATSTITDHGRAAWGVNTVGALATNSAGLIYGGGEQLFVYDSTSGPLYSPGAAISMAVLPGVRALVDIPDSEVYGVAAGKDGLVYAGGAFGGHLYAYHPVSGQVDDLGAPLADHYIYSLAAGQDGKIYGGTISANGFSPGHFFLYDPATGQFQDKGVPTTWTEYAVSALAVAPDGTVYGGTEGEGIGTPGRFFLYDPISDTIRQKGRVYTGDAVTALAVGSDGRVYGGTGLTGDGMLFVYDPVADTWPPDYLWVNPDDGWVLSVAAGDDGSVYFGLRESGHLMVYHPATGVQDLGEPVEGATDISALAFLDGLLYGVGNRHNYGRVEGILFIYDPGSQTFQALGQVAVGDDWVYDLDGGAGRLYGTTGWTQGRLFAFDPAYAPEWGTVHFTTLTPPGTEVQVNILAQDGTPLLADVANGEELDGIPAHAYPGIKLQAVLSTTHPYTSPSLLDWEVTWFTVAVVPPALPFVLDPSGPDVASATLEVRMGGEEAVNWSAAEDIEWLTALPLSGTAPAVMTVQVSRGGLTPGRYTGTITVEWGLSTPRRTDLVEVSLMIPEVRLFVPLVVRGP